MNKARVFFDKGLSLLLIASILVVSCTIPQSGPGAISSSALISASGRAIDLYLDDIRQYVEPDLPVRSVLDGADGYDVATRTMEEENGREYLEFTLETSRFETADEVFEAAEKLVPASELEEVKDRVKEAEERLFRAVEDDVRVLTPSQQEEFYNDLTALVIKSAVLLTAAVVYSLVPTTILWGKVTAASAVAIAAGVLSTTFISIIEHYKLDKDIDESFQSWLEDVTTEPSASWAIAAAMINLGASLERSPVLTALILGIFAVFNIVDEVKTMLSLNFDA